MANAKKEFLEHVAERDVKCAALWTGLAWLEEEKKCYDLPVGFDPAAFALFLEAIDFKYDDGYGGQELFGTIWYADGTWSSRGEYDGSEWWDYNSCPPVPENLQPPAES